LLYLFFYFLLFLVFFVTVSDVNAQVGVIVGSDALVLGSGQNLYYGVMSNSSNSAASGILIQKPSGSNLFRVDATGSLFTLNRAGIGAAATSPVETLDVDGRIYLRTTTAPATTANRLYSVGGNLFWNAIQLDVTPTGDSNWALSGSNLYASSTTWNVGIGTTSPLNKLHVLGGNGGATSLATAVTNAAMKLDYAGNPGIGMYYGFINFGGGAYQYIQSANYNGSTAYHLTLNPYGGNIGVGTTLPTDKLHIVGNMYNNGLATIGTNSTKNRNLELGTDLALSPNPGSTVFGALVKGADSGHLVFDLRNNDAADSIAFRYSSSNTPSAIDTIGFIMKATGRVGIGVTAPSQLLHVNGAAQFDAVSFGVTPGESQTLALTTVEYVNAKVGGTGGVGAGTSGMTLRHDGTGWVGNTNLYHDGTSIGIGTTLPGEKLDVVGNLRLGTQANRATISYVTNTAPDFNY